MPRALNLLVWSIIPQRLAARPRLPRPTGDGIPPAPKNTLAMSGLGAALGCQQVAVRAADKQVRPFRNAVRGPAHHDGRREGASGRQVDLGDVDRKVFLGWRRGPVACADARRGAEVDFGGRVGVVPEELRRVSG
jgi:hypothetical protein